MMETDVLRDKAIEMIKTIYDPEIPVNIHDLGLIYRVDILPINNIQVTMTLTAPGCPAAQIAACGSRPETQDHRRRE